MVKSPYEILGVAEGSPIDVCKKAYKVLAKKLHPDMPTGNEIKFKEISEALAKIEKGVPFTVETVVRRGNLRHSTLFTFV